MAMDRQVIVGVVLTLLVGACGGGRSEEAAPTTSRPTTTVTPTTTAPPRTTDTLRADLSTMQPDANCLHSFSAASVAASIGNLDARDRLYGETPETCPTLEDWINSAYRFPDAGGIARPNARLLLREMEMLCGFTQHAPLCADGFRRGFLNGKLDE
jgi:hypothetical protein